MPRILHQIENIYETLGLTCTRCFSRFVGVQVVVIYSRSWNKLLHNALNFVWNLYACVCVCWKMQSVENRHLQDVFLCDKDYYFGIFSSN